MFTSASSRWLRTIATVLAMPDDVPAILRDLELSLLQPAVRKDRAQLTRLLTEDFVEFGSSGRTFDREAVIAALQAESPLWPPRAVEELRIVLQTADAVLLTYRVSGLAPDGSGEQLASLRTSLWVRQDGTWKIRFHQGTRCPPNGASNG